MKKTAKNKKISSEVFPSMQSAAKRMGWPIQALKYAKGVSGSDAFHSSGRIYKDKLDKWMLSMIEESHGAEEGTSITEKLTCSCEGDRSLAMLPFWLARHLGQTKKAQSIEKCLLAIWKAEDALIIECGWGDDLPEPPLFDYEIDPLRPLGFLEPKRYMINRLEFEAEWEDGDWPNDLIYD